MQEVRVSILQGTMRNLRQTAPTSGQKQGTEASKLRRQARIPSLECGGGEKGPSLQDLRCLSRGPPSALSRASVLPLPQTLRPLRIGPGLTRAGPYGPDVTGGGGDRRLGEGVTSPGSAPRRAPSPALFCSGVAAGGGSEGAGLRRRGRGMAVKRTKGPRGQRAQP